MSRHAFTSLEERKGRRRRRREGREVEERGFYVVRCVAVLFTTPSRDVLPTIKCPPFSRCGIISGRWARGIIQCILDICMSALILFHIRILCLMYILPIKNKGSIGGLINHFYNSYYLLTTDTAICPYKMSTADSDRQLDDTKRNISSVIVREAYR